MDVNINEKVARLAFVDKVARSSIDCEPLKSYLLYSRS